MLIDSEALHRGAAVGATKEAGWRSSCSVEFCSGLGWDAWSSYDTGGTTLPEDELEQQAYAMPIINQLPADD